MVDHTWERCSIDFRFQWMEAISKDRPYHFPEVLQGSREECWDSPAVYRWRASRDDDKFSWGYVGEGARLRDRVNGYRNQRKKPDPGIGGPTTNWRIANRIAEWQAVGGSVSLELLRFDTLRFGRHVVRMDDLEKPQVRRFLEAWAILDHSMKDLELLNDDPRLRHELKVLYALKDWKILKSRSRTASHR